MTFDPHPPLDEDRALPDALRWQLRAQRRDIAPPGDLWAGIAARLEPPRTTRLRRAPLYALAASVLVAITAGALLLRPGLRPHGTSEIARIEAQQMTREYDAALRVMPDARATRELAPAIAELDRSAHEIRRALDRDPDSRLLLDQLRRTYSLRLELSQRAALS